MPHTSEATYETCRRHLDRVVGRQRGSCLQGKVDLSGVVQQTLLEAHLADRQVDEQRQVEHQVWLKRILMHNLNDEIRRFRSRKRDVRRERPLHADCELATASPGTQEASTDAAPLVHLERQERARQLAEALQRLPMAQRDALVLQHWHDCSIKDIATRMRRTQTAVGGLLKRALRRLREDLHALTER